MSGVISGVIAGMGGVVAPTITGVTGGWDAYESGSGSPYYNGYTSASNTTVYGYKQFYMYNNATNGSSSGSNSGNAIGFTVTGGGLTYEWQYLSYYGWIGLNIPYCTPKAYNGFTMLGDAGYNDAVTGGNTASLTFSQVYGYYSRNNTGTLYRGVDGFWRLKASNSAGTIYSPWTWVYKNWNQYNYDCNCYCPPWCNTYSCNCICDCDENGENCTGCCGTCCDCSEICDSCTSYYDQSYGYYNNWCA